MLSTMATLPWLYITIWTLVAYVNASKTLIDVLSADQQFTSLLKTLQKTRLIPVLNSYNQSTFFAPTNDAFDAYKGPKLTREDVLYHIIYNNSIIAQDLPQWAETALVQGDSLGERGQRLRIQQEKRDKLTVGNGANVVKKDLVADNGIIHAIDSILLPPVDIHSELKAIPELSFFRSILPPEAVNELITRPNFTLFAPHNDAFKHLDKVKRSYLQHTSAFDDVELLTHYASHANGVLYSDLISTGNLSTIAGQDLEIKVNKKTIAIGTGEVVERDHLAKNGVIHITSEITFPQSLVFTPRKYLVGMNATKFVDLLDQAKLSSYIDDPSNTLTLLAPRDDVFSDELPPAGSKEMEDLLRYHIVSSKLKSDELKDGMLIQTELKGRDLKGAKQRAKVFISNEDVSFNDASVIGSPSEVGNTMIYVISQVLQPPANAIQTTVLDLRLSTLVASVYSSGMDYILRTSPGITLLAPINEGFSKLGLTFNYLLLKEAKKELQDVIRYHMVDEVVYARDFRPGSHRYPTLAGSEIYIERTDDDDLVVHGGSSKGSASNGETEDGKVIEYDTLIQTGVVQLIDQVELPPQLDISLHKLLKGAKATTFLDMLKLCNLSYIVNTTTLPVLPTDRFFAFKEGAQTAYSILAPTDKAFSRINLTYYLSNMEELNRLVRLHIVPRAIPILHDEESHPTLLAEQGEGDDADILIREVGNGQFDVQVRGAKRNGNDRARILASGRTTGLSRKEVNGAIVGNVYTIDTVLMPYSRGWWEKWGWILVTVLGSVGGALLLIGLALKYRAWRRTKAGYEPLDNEED